jgi:hypothetical protein
VIGLPQVMAFSAIVAILNLIVSRCWVPSSPASTT